MNLRLWWGDVRCRVLGHKWEKRLLGYVCYRCWTFTGSTKAPE